MHVFNLPSLSGTNSDQSEIVALPSSCDISVDPRFILVVILEEP